MTDDNMKNAPPLPSVEKDNVDRRYGKFYTRRKRQHENKRINGPRSERIKRTRYTQLTSILEENRPIFTTVPRCLIDVPIQEDELTDIHTLYAPTSRETNTYGLIDVPIQVLPINTTIAPMPNTNIPPIPNITRPPTPTLVPPQSSTTCVSRASLGAYITTASSFHFPLRPPLGTFDAPASSSSVSKRQRTARTPRTSFTPFIIQTTLSRREHGTINQRIRRGRQTIEHRAASQARDTIRRRGARASQSSQQRALTQAVNTAYKRISSRTTVGQILSALNNQGRGQNN
ncbi:hypothetical protein ACHQM5_013833 [Ranunculus cassubicifolius]